MKPEIAKKIELLEEKYAVMGQDLSSYLDGLLYSDYLTYWDYVHVDTLLTLQNPRTSFPDEKIFIMYHQITELYFNLSLHELEQISLHEDLDLKFFTARMKRVVSYFDSLIQSFEVMIKGMEYEQFLKYRMALLPASGFQSAQYRMIEIYATDFINLIDKSVKDQFENIEVNKDTVNDFFENVYWKKGATELATGKKTLTLLQFEEKYSEKLTKLSRKRINNNIWKKYISLSESDQQNEELKNVLKEFDLAVNVHWPLMHYKSAVRYLHKKPEDIAATGGTNWQKYLPPRFQKRIFYPNLWTAQEIEDWGKHAFVDMKV